MSDILPLAQWSERDGRLSARPFAIIHMSYDAEAQRYSITEDPPTASKRAGFVTDGPNRWKLAPNPLKVASLDIVRRGDRTYIYNRSGGTGGTL